MRALLAGGRSAVAIVAVSLCKVWSLIAIEVFGMKGEVRNSEDGSGAFFIHNFSILTRFRHSDYEETLDL